jgi:hypothetical protein
VGDPEQATVLLGDWRFEFGRSITGNSLQIVMYYWCEAAELQLAV